MLTTLIKKKIDNESSMELIKKGDVEIRNEIGCKDQVFYLQYLVEREFYDEKNIDNALFKTLFH